MSLDKKELNPQELSWPKTESIFGLSISVNAYDITNICLTIIWIFPFLFLFQLSAPYSRGNNCQICNWHSEHHRNCFAVVIYTHGRMALYWLRTTFRSWLLYGKQHLFASILFFRQERRNMIELEVNNPNENQRAPYDEAYLIPMNNSVNNPDENQRASYDEAYITFQWKTWLMWITVHYLQHAQHGGQNSSISQHTTNTFMDFLGVIDRHRQFWLRWLSCHNLV